MKKVIILMFLLILLIPINVYAEEVSLYKCVDGDTAKFRVDGKIYTYRFLSIDTPETKHPKKGKEPYGKEASKYTCNALKNAKIIRVEYDDNATKEDKYERRLAWVFVDEELLQQKLVSNGLAKVAYLYGDYKYNDILKGEEKKAMNKEIGIWSNAKNKVVEEINFDKIWQYIRKIFKSML